GVIARSDAAAKVTVACFDQTIEPIYAGRAAEFGDAAIAKMRERQALGASNLELALSWAKAHVDGAKRVLLVTDGVATTGNDDAHALGALASGLKDVGVERLDAIAIGGIRDEAMLKHLATSGLASDGVVVDANGEASTVERRLTHATRSGIDVKIAGASFVWPKRLDGVQAGDTAIVFAELQAGTPLQVSLGSVAMAAPVAATVDRPLLERAWAQAKIASLVGASRASGEPDPQKEIVALSIAHRVLSPYTALLVLESEEDYARFKIDRRALTDVMAIEGGRVVLAKRDGIHAPQRPVPVPTIAASPSVSASASAVARSPSAPSPVPDPMSASAPPKPSPAEMHEPMTASSAAPMLAPPPAATEAKASALSSELDTLSVQTLGASGSGASAAGALRTGGGGGPISPGSHGGLSGIGDSSGGGGVGAGATTTMRVPASDARVGAVEGAGSRADVASKLARIRWKFKACHTRALQSDPTSAGRLRVSVSIGPTGDVQTARDAGGSTTSPALTACVLAAFKGVTFDPAPTTQTIVVPLVFAVTETTVTTTAAPESPPAMAAPYEGNLKIVMEAIAKGDVKAALEKARSWRSEAPGDVLALIALGESLEASKDTARALRAYGSIIDLFPSRADLRRFAGVRLERVKGGLELALDSFTRAVKQRPDHPHGHRLLAYALLKKGRYSDAFQAIVDARKWPYGDERFPGVDRILSEDLGLIAAAWAKAEPKRAAEARALVKQHKGVVEDKPSIRFVLNWETDNNDVDFHIYDDKGGHAYFSQTHLPSGGDLYADVTTGYGPECFTIRLPKSERAPKYTLQANYFSRGPMGYGMGKIEIIEHDGKGGLTFEERPYVVMIDHGFVDLGTVTK
ncbi:MAG: tetratricopeptide repeat protein, partial [Polyangiales bacterium]